MILLATLLYSIAIGLLAWGVAAAIARVLHARGRAERGVWATGLVAALALPLLLPALVTSGVAPAAGGMTAGSAAVIDLVPLRVGVNETPSLAWLAPSLLLVWALASIVLLIRFGLALGTVARLRRDSSAIPEVGDAVRVTPVHGPAVVGFMRPTVLLPAWVIDLPRGVVDWIVRHEYEHIRGRDPWLLALALLARIAAPWNPAVWIFTRSLRSAMETDCDRRTLSAGGNPAAYGEAILAVARGPRSGGVSLLPAMAPAFAERAVPIARRIEAMTRPRTRLGARARVALVGLAGAGVVVACEVPAPTAIETDAPAAVEADATQAASTSTSQLGFTPFETAPVLENRGEVAGELERRYPSELRAAGIGGRSTVWFHIDETGRVMDAQVRATSGHEALDLAALEVAKTMRFRPAKNAGEAVAVWVAIPITFDTGS
ncbi:MAG: M56 family metallopeptidase [Longimicrobiales bacterium]|nr:M56 family metallopeptidase [Longimicrobiales bacterium]